MEKLKQRIALLLTICSPFLTLNVLLEAFGQIEPNIIYISKIFCVEIGIVSILFAVAMKHLDIICDKSEEWFVYFENVLYHQYFGILKGISCNDICVICREELIQKRCVVLECGHVFHRLCIVKWERRSYYIRFINRCTICNQMYRICERNCFWEPSCTTHDDNAVWKGYRVGDVRCGTDGCRRKTFTCPRGKECLALCNGRNACDNAAIIADFSTSLTVIGSYHSLQLAVVRCPRNEQCNVECKGYVSCQYTKVYYHDLAELNVICTGSDSCIGLQKLSSVNAFGAMNIMADVPVPVVSLQTWISPWIMPIGSLFAVLLLVTLLIIYYKNCGGNLSCS